MEYRAVKPIPIKLADGEERFLKFTFASALKYKELTGRSLFAQEEIKPDDVPSLIFAALVGKPKDLTVDDVAELLDFANIHYYLETVAEAINEQVSAGGAAKNAKGPSRKKKAAATQS